MWSGSNAQPTIRPGEKLQPEDLPDWKLSSTSGKTILHGVFCGEGKAPQSTVTSTMSLGRPENVGRESIPALLISM